MNTNQHSNPVFDLLIIGGGINGCGIARDASGRGLNVALCEQYDLANETSSRSTKMLHGGLRYLEYYEFRLVREALAERDVLMGIAPHMVQPLQLIIPHNDLQRPAWLIRIGLFLYDHLGFKFGKRSKIPKSTHVRLNNESPYGKPLNPELVQGFSYYDCKTDDARLVVLNALDAKQRGANIMTHTQFINAVPNNDEWLCTLKNAGGEFKLRAKALVNTAGPWVDDIALDKLHLNTKNRIKLIKGSHIVVPKLYEGEHAYLLQSDDKRVIFVAPYHTDFTMIGTTDIPYDGDPTQVQTELDEKHYLCNIVNRYFRPTITPDDIVNDWSGVRALHADDADNPSAITRDYLLELKTDTSHPPILSAYGGKLTTYRRLAEHAMEKLHSQFAKLGPSWTASQPLPGGDIDPDTYTVTLQQRYPLLPLALLRRYVTSYGSCAELILGGVKTHQDLGTDFGHGLYQREVDYLLEHEWAQSAADILWRRSKLGLTDVNHDALAAYIASQKQS